MVPNLFDNLVHVFGPRGEIIVPNTVKGKLESDFRTLGEALVEFGLVCDKVSHVCGVGTVVLVRVVGNLTGHVGEVLSFVVHGLSVKLDVVKAGLEEHVVDLRIKQHAALAKVQTPVHPRKPHVAKGERNVCVLVHCEREMHLLEFSVTRLGAFTNKRTDIVSADSEEWFKVGGGGVDLNREPETDILLGAEDGRKGDAVVDALGKVVVDPRHGGGIQPASISDGTQTHIHLAVGREHHHAHAVPSSVVAQIRPLLRCEGAHPLCSVGAGPLHRQFGVSKDNGIVIWNARSAFEREGVPVGVLIEVDDVRRGAVGVVNVLGQSVEGGAGAENQCLEGEVEVHQACCNFIRPADENAAARGTSLCPESKGPSLNVIRSGRGSIRAHCCVCRAVSKHNLLEPESIATNYRLGIIVVCRGEFPPGRNLCKIRLTVSCRGGCILPCIVQNCVVCRATRHEIVNDLAGGCGC
eukprot:comp8570_c0_seq1/m.3859 comp8570_c0_seq1/g.3859  ORF comp8570_c0_seq1/g.3859 comp8570_c0_seq1/m.3859 type:complete len:467 (+) comp8570_c0_seq1:1844-3244(+)